MCVWLDLLCCKRLPFCLPQCRGPPQILGYVLGLPGLYVSSTVTPKHHCCSVIAGEDGLRQILIQLHVFIPPDTLPAPDLGGYGPNSFSGDHMVVC